MNKTESVSIGRRGFVCEQDAYKVLQDYLLRAEKALKNDPDQKEILADLELSMAGHLAEQSGQLVVDLETAKTVVDLMGEVSADENLHDNKNKSVDADTANNESFSERLSQMFKKPLYKDHDRELVDGVCAGIAKPLAVDPVWVRLLFVLLTIITQGAAIVLYLILLVVMKDEPTYEQKTSGEVIGNIRKKLTTTAEGARPYEMALRKLIGGIFTVIWTLLRIVVCVVLVVASIVWASYLFFMLSTPDQVAIFNGQPGWLEFVTVFSGGLVLLIPLFELLVAMFGSKVSKSRMSLALWSIWALSLITFVAGVVNVYPKVEKYLTTIQPKNNFVHVQMVGDEIASLCISPLGTCSDTEQILSAERLCDFDVVIYNKDDRPVWMMRGWDNVFKSLEYPVSNVQYCAEMAQIIQREGSNQVLFARQDLNDPAYVSNEVIVQNKEVPNYSVPSDVPYWQMEYMVRN